MESQEQEKGVYSLSLRTSRKLNGYMQVRILSSPPMDNRIFNVNGVCADTLRDALRLAFIQADVKKAEGWSVSKKHGLLLHRWIVSTEGVTKLPTPLDADQCFIFVHSWLTTDAAKETEALDWDAPDYDTDGSEADGWRVYVEDWGNVGDFSDIICAIKPAAMWYGK